MSRISDKELGCAIGEVIVALVDLIALVDGSSRNEVLEELFAGWWESRIEDAQ